MTFGAADGGERFAVQDGDGRVEVLRSVRGVVVELVLQGSGCGEDAAEVGESGLAEDGDACGGGSGGVRR